MSLSLMTSSSAVPDHLYAHSEIVERPTFLFFARSSCTTSCCDVWGAGAGNTSFRDPRDASVDPGGTWMPRSRQLGHLPSVGTPKSLHQTLGLHGEPQ
eukprot:3650623-Amphidinium_carterae.3